MLKKLQENRLGEPLVRNNVGLTPFLIGVRLMLNYILIIKTETMKQILVKFTLKLNIDSWGKYKKGDEDIFYISVFDERNGLIRFPIDKHWDIVKYEW